MKCICEHCEAMREIDKLVDQTGLDDTLQLASISGVSFVQYKVDEQTGIAYPPFSKEG